MRPVLRLTALSTLLGLASAAIADGPAAEGVASIQAGHDRALIKDLLAYLARHPDAADVDQASMIVFNKAIEHDWFLDNEAAARDYLKAHPDGAVKPLAQIVATMARAQAGAFAEALASFKALLDGLGGVDQVDFASNFAENLATSASAAGEVGVARDVYRSLLRKFGTDSQSLRSKVEADLARLDLVGRPAPEADVRDIDGKRFRLDGLRGKYVLVDFWATWCAPCLAELPRVQAAQAKYKAKGFEVVSVSLDETKGAVVDFVRVRKVPWTQIHNATCDGDLVQAFGVTTIPATFLVDPEGRIVRLDLRGPALDRALESLLK